QQGRDLANFDITYRSPSWYPLASVGDRTDSTVDGKVLTTRWVTRLPTPYATFNLGLFDNHRVQHPDAPPLDVLLSEEAHRLLRRQLQAQGLFLPQQRNMRDVVAADVSNSLKWFTHVFGPCSFDHFWVTEIPYFEGVSFPGMIDLSWSTFQNSSLDGFDEFFRAHEVAHQWWGNGVRPASYRDAWLSEGLASFSALWYLQSLRKRNNEYLKFLDQYEADIRVNRNEAGPIWLGYRNASPTAPYGYQVMIYEKGAWVFHMLRTLMLDLQTQKEGRFTGMMRDFYETYQGKAATTEDFQRVVERHAGIPMDWFFDQWVKGTAIPTYRVAWTGEPADGGKYRVRLRVTQEDVPPDFQMWVLVSADLGNNRFANFRIGVRGGKTEYVSPLLPSQPTKI
ncbi:MAG: M1 family metallopeptidase, partial [bacterium]